MSYYYRFRRSLAAVIRDKYACDWSDRICTKNKFSTIENLTNAVYYPHPCWTITYLHTSRLKWSATRRFLQAYNMKHSKVLLLVLFEGNWSAIPHPFTRSRVTRSSPLQCTVSSNVANICRCDRRCRWNVASGIIVWCMGGGWATCSLTTEVKWKQSSTLPGNNLLVFNTFINTCVNRYVTITKCYVLKRRWLKWYWYQLRFIYEKYTKWLFLCFSHFGSLEQKFV